MTYDDTGIAVTGTGTATTDPDIARIHLGVSVRAETVAEASALARDRAAALLERLTAEGVPKSDIKTTNYSVHADHDHPRGKERLLGYRVNNDLQVTLRDLATVGSIIDRTVEVGGDDVTVGRLDFDIEDDSEARSRARDAAWEDAAAKARQLAELAGLELGAAVRIAETTVGSPGPRMLAAPMAAEATSIEAGTSTVTVRLEVRFSIA